MTPDLVEHTIRTEHVGNRRVRVLRPAVPSDTSGLLVLLDGEFYSDRMPTADLITEGQHSGRLAPFSTLFVDAGGQRERWRDCQCSEDFGRFLADDLLSWSRDAIGPSERVSLGGLSLSGLQAAFTAIRHADTFDRVFAQSPSFWWREGWIAEFCESVARSNLPSVRMRVSCGLDETAENVEHGPGLHQTMSQLAGCRRVRDVLARLGSPLDHVEISGGHDFDTWTRDLPDCLDFVFGRTP